MDEKLKSLREAYDAKSQEAQALLGRGPEITAEDVAKVKGLNDELNALSEQMSTLSEAGRLVGVTKARDEAMNQPVRSIPLPGGGGHAVPGMEGAPATFLGFAPAGYADFEQTKRATYLEQFGPGIFQEKQWTAINEPDYKTNFWGMVRKQGFHTLSNTQQKLLQEGIDTDGGFLVPTDWQNRIISRKPTPTRIANFVQTFNTSRDSITLPRVVYAADDIYTSGMRITWTGEVPASSTAHQATQPVFGNIKIPIYTAMMSLPVTRDLLEDNAVNLEGWLEDKFSETIELLIDNMILNGTGAGMPAGVLINPGTTDQPATVVSGDATLLTPDGLVNLGWSLPEQYDENGRFVMNKTNTGRQVALLKDADDRYLWGMGLQDSGLSPTIRGRELLGYPVVFSGFMPNVAANAYPILFGDLRGIYLVRRIGFTIEVLREINALLNQVVILARVRFGAAVAEPFRLRVMKVSV